MKSGWYSPRGPFNRIVEVVDNYKSVEPVELYNERYARGVDLLSDPELEDPYRYFNEVLVEFDKGSSLLVFGSGHGYNVNVFSKEGCFNKITAWDMADEAKTGLDEEIYFFNKDVLSYTPEECMIHDYVFTSHTIEHFTRKEILINVIPKLLLLARKALVIIVPHANNWEEEKTHKCRFYLNDELASISDRVKLIRNGVEAVYWVGVE